MSTILNNADTIKQFFSEYCREKGYQIKEKKDKNNDWRLQISNSREQTLLIIYHTGTIVMGGPQNKLKEEFENIKENYKDNPASYGAVIKKKPLNCNTTYSIISKEFKDKIKENLKILSLLVEIENRPDTNIEYLARINKNNSTIAITQYNTGTLLIQGKKDSLFDKTCDMVEQIANPAEDQVIARFISENEKNLEYFAAKYSPKLLEISEKELKEELDIVFNYFEEHDRKWFIASKCLCLTQIPLPEYSPLVMPASKAFEGFAKKLLVDVGFYEKDHFNSVTAKFDNLGNKSYSKRHELCKIQRHAGSYLDQINLARDKYRNFMMHSDDSDVTKLKDLKEAEDILDEICKQTKEIFEYFNKYFLN